MEPVTHAPRRAPQPRRRIAVACLGAFVCLTGLVATHVVDAADLRVEVLLAGVVRRLGVVDAVQHLYVSSELAFVVLLGLAVAYAWQSGRIGLRRLAVEVPLALVAAEGLARLLEPVIGRARPFVAHPLLFDPIGSANIDPSFPSDGATAAFAIATVVALSYRRLAVPAYAVAVMVAVGRLLAAVHYPTDVLAGTLVGVASAVLVCWVSRRLKPATDAADEMGVGQRWQPEGETFN